MTSGAAARQWIPLLLAAQLALGCRRVHTDAQASAPRATTPAAIAAGRVPAGATAFDLALFADGALLVWGAPHASGGGIWLQILDARGAARGPARRVAQTDAGGEVLELAATGIGSKLGAAWIESNASESRTRGLLLAPSETTPPEPTRIATGSPIAEPSRSHLAVAASAEGRMRVLYADAPTKCVEPASGPCIGYGFREIGEGARALAGQWLAVPQPCAHGAPSLTARADRLYYAVCSTNEGQANTVAYSINVQTEYARADEVLHGCDPLGMLVLDDGDGALLVADCNGVRRAVELTLAPRPPIERTLSEREVSCDGGLPNVRASEFSLVLHGARERLESVLPDELAPPGARAVWTGRALLIAHPAPGGIELVSLACKAGSLRVVDD